MSRPTFGLAAALLLAIPLSAQQATTPQPTTPATKPAEAPARGQPVNIKIDLTISDRTGPGEPAKRAITMIVSDRRAGNIRSAANDERARLFVDASPTILANGDVELSLGMEYNPRQVAAGKPAEPSVALRPEPGGGTSLNQRITLILQSGKPLQISQSADPISDRSITVEVRATVMK
jgi:hypothetical protein